MTILLVVLIVVAFAAWLLLRGPRPQSRELPSASDRKLDRPSSPEHSKSSIESATPSAVTPAASQPDQVASVSIKAVTTERIESQQTTLQPLERNEVAGSTFPSIRSEATHDIDELRKGLDRSRRAEGFFGRLAAILRGKKELDASIAAEIEEVLLTSDVGVQTTQTITERIRETLSKQQMKDSNVVWEAVRDEAKRILHAAATGRVAKDSEEASGDHAGRRQWGRQNHNNWQTRYTIQIARSVGAASGRRHVSRCSRTTAVSLG